jgi:hypothetical protein
LLLEHIAGKEESSSKEENWGMLARHENCGEGLEETREENILMTEETANETCDEVKSIIVV